MFESQKWDHPYYSPLIQTNSRAPSTEMGPSFLQSTHTDQQSCSNHRNGTTLITVHSYRPTVGLQAQKWDHPFYSPLIQTNRWDPSTEMGPPFLQSTHSDQQSGSKHRNGTTLFTVHSYRQTVGLEAQKRDHPFYSPLIQTNSRAPSTEMGPPFLQSTHRDQQSGSKHKNGTTLCTVHSYRPTVGLQAQK